MSPQQQQNTKRSYSTLNKKKYLRKTKLLGQDRHVRENTAALTDKVTHKNASPHSLRNATRTQGENYKGTEKGAKEPQKANENTPGTKREKPTKSLAYIRKEKKEESCDERKHRNVPFRQPHSRRHYQKVANYSHCLRESHKKEPASGGEKTEQKSSSQKPKEGLETTGSDMERTRCRSTTSKTQAKDNLRITRALSERNDSKNLSERPQREEKAESKLSNKDSRMNLPQDQRRVHNLQ